MIELAEVLRALAIDYGLKVLGSIAIFVLGRWLAGLLVNALKSVLQKARVDHTLVSFFGNVFYYVLFVLVIVAALNNLGVPTTSVVAILGAVTLAVGLALQDSLGNLASGVMIILLHPYRVGDYVEISDVEGYVTEIQIFHTLLLTRDNKIVFIPNNDVMDGNIVNYSKSKWIRLDLVFGISYNDDLLKAQRILQEILQADERIAQDPAPVVAVMELTNDGVNLAVRPYVKVRDYIPVSFAVTEQVKLRFDQEGITFPFAQHDVRLYQMN